MISLQENMDVCAEQYRYVTALYWLSILKRAYIIIIDCYIIVPGHGREFVDGFIDTEKWLVTMMKKTVQISDTSDYDSHMAMHNSTVNTDTSFVSEFRKRLSDLT